MPDSVAVSSNSRSRTFVTDVNLCALVNGGQHLHAFEFFFMFHIYHGRSGVATAISKGVPVFLAPSKLGTRFFFFFFFLFFS